VRNHDTLGLAGGAGRVEKAVEVLRTGTGDFCGGGRSRRWKRRKRRKRREDFF
jgi:hypothetical protein